MVAGGGRPSLAIQAGQGPRSHAKSFYLLSVCSDRLPETLRHDHWCAIVCEGLRSNASCCQHRDASRAAVPCVCRNGIQCWPRNRLERHQRPVGPGAMSRGRAASRRRAMGIRFSRTLTLVQLWQSYGIGCRRLRLGGRIGSRLCHHSIIRFDRVHICARTARSYDR
jgi:hypothetical protein